jgi:hypothetical protein
MASSKATTLLFMIAMIVLLASLEVGEGIRWKTDKICYKECSDKCAAATRSLCEGMCKLECTFMECFFCVSQVHICFFFSGQTHLAAENEDYGIKLSA